MASLAVSTRRILQSRPSTSYPSYSMNGKIIVSALAILCVIVLIIIFLHVYTRRLRRRSSSMSRRHAALHQSLFSQDTAAHSGSGGLSREIVEALPVFTYKPQLSLPKAATMAASEGVECVVCLSDFQEDEGCKLLPKCQHFFHIKCIEMWFLSNMTCPLCRAPAADPHTDGDEEAARADVGCVSMSACCFTKQDGEEHYQRPITPTSGGGARDDIAVSGGSFSLQSPAMSRNYRRSKSEKFSKGTQQRPSSATNNFYEGGNHTHMTVRMNRTRWQTGGRSFSHTTLDISKPHESNLFEVSSGRALPTGSPAVASCAASSSGELKAFY